MRRAVALLALALTTATTTGLGAAPALADPAPAAPDLGVRVSAGTEDAGRGTWSIAVSPVTAVATAVPSKLVVTVDQGLTVRTLGKAPKGCVVAGRGLTCDSSAVTTRGDLFFSVKVAHLTNVARGSKVRVTARVTTTGDTNAANDTSSQAVKSRGHGNVSIAVSGPKSVRTGSTFTLRYKLTNHTGVPVHLHVGNSYLWYDIDTVKGDKVVAMPKGCHAESPSWYCYDVKVKAHSSRTLVFKAKLGTKHVGHTVKLKTSVAVRYDDPFDTKASDDRVTKKLKVLKKR
ncbi:hypothetical protein [Angustibacter aerolatus]